MLQVSERGSIVDSATSSREKVADWLIANQSDGKTQGKELGEQERSNSKVVPPAPKELNVGQRISSMTTKAPTIRKTVSILPPSSVSLQPRQTPAQSNNLFTETASHNHDGRPASHPGTDPSPQPRALTHEIPSVTVTQPCRQYISNSEPVRKGNGTGSNAHHLSVCGQNTVHGEAASWTPPPRRIITPLRHSSPVSPEPIAPQYNLPILHSREEWRQINHNAGQGADDDRFVHGQTHRQQIPTRAQNL